MLSFFYHYFHFFFLETNAPIKRKRNKKSRGNYVVHIQYAIYYLDVILIYMIMKVQIKIRVWFRYILSAPSFRTVPFGQNQYQVSDTLVRTKCWKFINWIIINIPSSDHIIRKNMYIQKKLGIHQILQFIDFCRCESIRIASCKNLCLF